MSPKITILCYNSKRRVVEHMLVFEAKLEGTTKQYGALDEAIRTARFIRNKCLRYWMENRGVGKYDLSKYSTKLRHEFEWCKKLSAQACQASADRAWSSISRFYDNCKKKVPGKKGYPKFKKHQSHGSVEYKVDGWKLSSDRRELTFRDGFKAGTFKLWGPRDLHFYQIEQIKRVRVVRRADGYYAQFCIDVERNEEHKFTGKMLGLDVGLNHFYTDSEGNTKENPRFLRRGEKKLKRLQRRLSRKQKGSQNRARARNRLGRAHLMVQRRRKDFAVKLAREVIQSSDLVAFEDLKVRNMVKNHHLAKSISDAAWTQFREWLEYFGKVFKVPVIAVPPSNTSQDCSKCGKKVHKSLSTRTHKCPHCGHIQDRDWNAAINILKKALELIVKQNTVGHTEIEACGESGHCLAGATPKGKSSRRSRKSKSRGLESHTIP